MLRTRRWYCFLWLRQYIGSEIALWPSATLHPHEGLKIDKKSREDSRTRRKLPSIKESNEEKLKRLRGKYGISEKDTEKVPLAVGGTATGTNTGTGAGANAGTGDYWNTGTHC